VERGALEIARAVVEAGGRALVASEGGRLGLRIEGFGAELIEGPYASKNPVTILRNAGALAEIVRAEAVDIVHARSRAPAWSAWLAARRTGTPFVTTWHGVYGEREPFKRLYNSVMGKGRPVIAISQFIAELAQERYGVPASAIEIDPPRRRSRAVHRGERRRRARHRAGAGLGRGRGSPPHRAAAGPAGLELEGAGRVRRRRGAAEGAARGRFHRADRRRRWRRRRRAAGRGGAGAGCARRGAGRARLRGHAGGLQALRRRGLRLHRAGSVRAGGGGGAGDGPPGGRDRPWRRARDGGAGRDRLALPARRRRGAGDALDAALSLDPAARAQMGARGRARVADRFTVAAMQAATLRIYERLAGRRFAGAPPQD
jgi:glycosyltransferase involved in cell wall biosynthesis